MSKINNYRYAHEEGHTDICYAQNSKYIVTCGCEGDVRIWESVNDPDQKDNCVGERAWSIAQKGNSLYVGADTNIVQAYTFPGMEKDGIITRFTAPVTQIDLSPDGSTLLAGSCDMEIRLVDLNSMDCKLFLGHKAPILSISLDPKLEYIVSSSCDGAVKVWSIETKSVLKVWSTGINKTNSFETSTSLCRMHFDPKDGNSLAVPEGNVIKIYERITWNEIKSFSCLTQVSVVKFSPNSRLLAAGTVSGDILIWELSSGRQLVPLDKAKNSRAENHCISGLSWKKDCTSLVFCNVAGQLAEFDTPKLEAEISSVQNIEEVSNDGDIPLGVPQFDDDDDDEDNENTISLNKIKSETGFGEDGEYINSHREAAVPNIDEDSRSSDRSHSYPKIPEVQLQSAFQPSSTPHHLQQRFMVWNNIGIVRQFDGEGMNDIDIEFHDTSVHHNFRMNNVAGHTMGTLTTKALILACPSNDGTPGKLTCVLLGSRDSQKEWDVALMEGEEPVGVAGGSDWISIATSQSLIRLMTVDGTQTDVVSLQGKFVSMTGYDSLLAVVFHSAGGGLCYNVYKCQEMLLTLPVPTAPLPLSLGEQSIRWIGFTDEGSLATYDSSGVLHIQYINVWRPVSYLDDECKSKFDHYFIVGVSELYQTARCILCKGTYYPQVIPKPLICEIKWKFPLCEMDVEKSQLEEEYLRSRLTAPHLSLDSVEDGKKAIEKVISITAMKLFALACRGNLDSRAITLCEIMPSIEVVNLASKYAVKIGRQNLATKVTEVANRFANQVNSNVDYIREEAKPWERGHDSKKNPSPIRDNYSQDMFEDSQMETPSAKENLILKMQEKKRKEKEMSPKPLRIIRSGNPFKKDDEKLSSASNSSTNGENPNHVKVNFIKWYGDNKQVLQEEYPLLKESELLMAAMKKYKQANNSHASDSQESDKSFVSVNNETKKRKARTSGDETENILNKKKPSSSLSKLKSFSFKKQ